jgi:hypothetical protein
MLLQALYAASRRLRYTELEFSRVLPDEKRQIADRLDVKEEVEHFVQPIDARDTFAITFESAQPIAGRGELRQPRIGDVMISCPPAFTKHAW